MTREIFIRTMLGVAFLIAGANMSSEAKADTPACYCYGPCPQNGGPEIGYRPSTYMWDSTTYEECGNKCKSENLGLPSAFCPWGGTGDMICHDQNGNPH